MLETAQSSNQAIAKKIDETIQRDLRQSLDKTIDKFVVDRLETALLERVDYLISQRLDKALRTDARWANLQVLEQVIEDKLLFGSRWILLPAYVLLTCVLLVLCYKAGEEFVQLVTEMRPFQHGKTLTQALVIVDIILSMNLVLMVLFVGYTNFVSRIHPARIEDWPEWPQKMDYSGLKLQLLGSIIAISAIILLGELITIIDEHDLNTTRVELLIGIHMTFVVSALVMAWVNKLKHADTEKRS